MARYFMSGTRYEDFERMMMSTDRKGRDEADDEGNFFPDEATTPKEARM